jgi:hypothetical protein
MRNKNPQLFLIFLIVFLVLVHGTTCRDTKRSTSNGETEQGSKTKHSSMFLQALSSIFKASESSTNNIKALHTVSRRLVPCGPNPLHNWSSNQQNSNLFPFVEIYIVFLKYFCWIIYTYFPYTSSFEDCWIKVFFFFLPVLIWTALYYCLDTQKTETIKAKKINLCFFSLEDINSL